jgi:hypothetical protein
VLTGVHIPSMGAGVVGRGRGSPVCGKGEDEGGTVVAVGGSAAGVAGGCCAAGFAGYAARSSVQRTVTTALRRLAPMVARWALVDIDVGPEVGGLLPRILDRVAREVGDPPAARGTGMAHHLGTICRRILTQF